MIDPAQPKIPTILQVLPALGTGGVERGTVEITQAIAAAGWRALVASDGGPRAAHVERAGGRNFLLPLETKNPFTILRNASRLAALIRAENVDIIHARSRAPAWSAWLAARRTGRKFVTTYHGAYSEDFPLKRQYNTIMARGDRVIAISRYIADLIGQRHMSVRADRIRVIPRGVDIAAFDPAAVTGNRVVRLAQAWRLQTAPKSSCCPAVLPAGKGRGFCSMPSPNWGGTMWSACSSVAASHAPWRPSQPAPKASASPNASACPAIATICPPP